MATGMRVIRRALLAALIVAALPATASAAPPIVLMQYGPPELALPPVDPNLTAALTGDGKGQRTSSGTTGTTRGGGDGPSSTSATPATHAPQPLVAMPAKTPLSSLNADDARSSALFTIREIALSIVVLLTVSMSGFALRRVARRGG